MGDLSLWQRFAFIAGQQPDAIALKFADGRRIRFAELRQSADHMAAGLAQRGIRTGDVVALVHDKSFEGISAMLALIGLGAAYVNLDDQIPVERAVQILEASGSKLLLSGNGAFEHANLPCKSVSLLQVPVSNGNWTAFEPDIAEAERLPAYIMFTSGSTGVPKGAVITQASVNRFINWARDEFSISSNDCLTSVNPLYFDNSVFDFYASLFNGASLALIGRALTKQPGPLVKTIADAACTIWFSVPTLLVYLLALRQLSANSWPHMRAIVFGGEGFPKPKLKQLHAMFSTRARLVNVYGPTECTCICSAQTISDEDLVDLEGFAKLGKLTRDFNFKIVDEDHRPVPAGQPGELHLLGSQVGLGYINDPERTQASFSGISAKFEPHERCYRTGDLVRVDDVGDLWFVGRKDNQIKHQGHRIELEEIDHALAQFPGIKRAAAVYVKHPDRPGKIIAFAAVDSAFRMSAEDLREAVCRRLPSYMAPESIKLLDDLPINANGKVDRRALLLLSQ